MKVQHLSDKDKLKLSNICHKKQTHKTITNRLQVHSIDFVTKKTNFHEPECGVYFDQQMHASCILFSTGNTVTYIDGPLSVHVGLMLGSPK